MQYSGFEYIDLGLSVYWAKMNIGANDIYDCGLYFQSGITYGRTICEVLNNTKLFSDVGVLNAEKDASKDSANEYMGGHWRMPTRQELCELMNNTTVKQINVSDRTIFEFISKINGTSLLVPCGGYLCSYHRNEFNHSARLWGQAKTYPKMDPCLKINDSCVPYFDYESWFLGYNVRGVFTRQLELNF